MVFEDNLFKPKINLVVNKIRSNLSEFRLSLVISTANVVLLAQPELNV
jgi:hypothetical protein